MSTIHGSFNDDVIFILPGYDQVYAGRGNDIINLRTTENVDVDGGLGCDTFKFRVFDDQTFTISDTVDDRTVVKIFDDGVQIQKIVLFDVEQVDWSIVG